MLTIVCWKWEPLNPNYRSKFDASTVNTFRSMVERHYHGPHEVVCITDNPIGIDERVRIVPLWDDFRFVQSPLGVEYPACYVRLRAFDASMHSVLGNRFISVDLDCVITNDVTDLWNRREDFVIWENNTRPFTSPGTPLKPITPYNGSMWMMNAGARQQVFSDFDPHKSPIETYNAGYVGSDQAWFAHCLGPKEATWKSLDGVYSWRQHMKNRMYMLPEDARIVFFQGGEDPWDQSARDKAPWIEEHYR